MNSFNQQQQEKMNISQILNQGITTQFQSAWNQMQNEALNQALADYGKGIQEAISLKSGGFTNQSMDVQQGFAAEAHHVGSFNIEAAAKGENNYRATRDVGTHNDPVADIHIKTPDGTTKHQVKFYKDGEKTAAALSPQKYDGIGKIVPKDQVQDVKTVASKQAKRNQETRPNVSKSNQDTANNATDTLTSSDGKVSSKGLNRRGKNSSEELVKEAKTQKNGPEYKDKQRVRSEFNAMQYRNAAKSGAIGGMVSESASILLEVLRSDKPLTIEDCEKAAKRVVISAVKGAGNALLVTSIQHVGQSLIDTASQQATNKAIGQTLGKHLIKGSVAAAIAQITTQLAQNLYKFSQGEIDSLELTSSTVGGVAQTVGASLAFSAGTGVATYIGAIFPAAVSGYAVFGTTLGSLGVMAVGTVFSIGFALAAGAYVNHFSSKGFKIANRDLSLALEQLNGGKINLSTYIGKVGKMSELTFDWRDALPFSGAISVISEYRTRKNQLKSTQSYLLDQLHSLPEQERELLRELASQYKQTIASIDLQYETARSDITQQALEHFDVMEQELKQYLEVQYLCYSPIRKNYAENVVLLELEAKREKEKERRMKFFEKELALLKNKIGSGNDSDDVQRILHSTIQSQMENLVPHNTGWDKACEFLYG